MRSAFWRTLYFGWAYGFRERPFQWAVSPSPRWANRVSEWLHRKWMEGDDD